MVPLKHMAFFTFYIYDSKSMYCIHSSWTFLFSFQFLCLKLICNNHYVCFCAWKHAWEPLFDYVLICFHSLNNGINRLSFYWIFCGCNYLWNFDFADGSLYDNGKCCRLAFIWTKSYWFKLKRTSIHFTCRISRCNL